VKKNWIVIISLAVLIALLIGFKKPIQKLMTRGYINKNPGNIRQNNETWQGEVIPSGDPDFKEFKSMPLGYRAMFVLLRTYIIRLGLDTVRKIVSVYAPPSENQTEAYINSVIKQTGLDPDEVIDINDSNTMKNLVAAISYHENGITPDLRDIDNGYNLFIG
jgi:hypothetical protein